MKILVCGGAGFIGSAFIKNHLKNTKIKIIHGKKDPDKRDYFVSNKKIEKEIKPPYNQLINP